MTTRLSIADPPVNDDFAADFLDDYFAECEEHLTTLRRDLLAIESWVGKPRVATPLLDRLFRACHSLKGISGMVGARDAELLSHHMESSLRDLKQGARPTAKRAEALIAATRLLEEVIVARYKKTTPPEIRPTIARLEDRDESSALAIETPGLNIGDAIEQERNGAESWSEDAPELPAGPLWRFAFTPTPELAGRGVNVNVVRERLKALGELVSAAPIVAPGGGISFEFIVATQSEESAFAELAADGITCTLQSAPQPPAETDHASSTGKASVAAGHTQSGLVRVSLARLDELMRIVGELVISRSRLDENIKNAEIEMSAARWRPLQETNVTIERQLRDLRESIMRARMVSVGEIFERMRFVIRDLTREYHKSVTLELHGQETEIDKLIVERMMDPLLHLVRNAVSHGLETSREREGLGKSPNGTLVLRAFGVAETVMIEVRDDGRGIDRQKVAERAQHLGLIPGDVELDDSALLDLICSPGFSTRDQADLASGRGVGMSVVRSAVLGLGGTLALETRAGLGTCFTIQLPVTLAIAEALLVSVGEHRFAVPQSSVQEVIEVDPAAVKSFENNEVIPYRGGVLPIARLARLFGLKENYRRAFHAFVVGNGPAAVGFGVDRILGQREIVIRTINDPAIQVPGISGATELGDGRLVLILDPFRLRRQSV